MAKEEKELLYLDKNEEFSKLSRYQILRVIEEGKETYLESYNQIKVPVSPEDRYHIVQHSEANRLDIIANLYYQDPTLYWVIALANDFVDPFIVTEGSMIRIPDMLTINNISYKILYR